MPVDVVLAEKLEVFPFLKIKPPLWLNRVKWNPSIHFHCFYHDSQCLRTKIKFPCGCGASRQVGSISIYKNKVPPLLLHRVKWSPFRYSHFLPSHPMFVNKSKICLWEWWYQKWKSISISIPSAPSLWLLRVMWNPFIHSHSFYHDSQCLRTKMKFACGCGTSRKAASISIPKNKAPPCD